MGYDDPREVETFPSWLKLRAPQTDGERCSIDTEYTDVSQILIRITLVVKDFCDNILVICDQTLTSLLSSGHNKNMISAFYEISFKNITPVIIK